ncbi:sensor histidine kinase [Algibacillus agarilyticus]|uniref:sensor histidine kinase n=1 Tax=Algibacillus agarilyticus TaxID=2234133 RepID=UPI0018E4E73E|nr:ATP-binding protein [Algibacillus agarilyticus]
MTEHTILMEGIFKSSMQISCIDALNIIALECDDNISQFDEALSLMEYLFNANDILLGSVFEDHANEEVSLTWFGPTTKIAHHQHRLPFSSCEQLPWLMALLKGQDKYLRIEPQDLIKQFGLVFPENNTVTLIALRAKGQLVGFLAFSSVKNDRAICGSYVALFNTLRLVFFNRQQKIQLTHDLQAHQQVMDLMPQRVFWKNKRSVYLGGNLAFANDANLTSPDELVGVTDYDIFPEQAELYRRDDANTMDTRVHLINSEEPQTHANGQTIWLRTSKRPIINSYNEVIGVIGTYDDISELKNIQAELSLAKEKLEERVIERTKALSESNVRLETALVDLSQAQAHLVDKEKMAALGGLVAGIAHEINTPVGIAVTGSSHLVSVVNKIQAGLNAGSLTKLKFESFCAELSTGCEIVLKNLQRASEQISNFKLIAVDQSHDTQRNINVKNYIEGVITTLKPKLRAYHVNIDLQVTPAALDVVLYPGALSQILTNLIENTLIHAFINSNDAQVSIHAFVNADNQFELCFKDNGQGMSDEVRKKIFDPFYTTNRATGGSGLGLHIIFNLVTQRLKGQIVCLSEPDKGTEFNITFPL